MNYRLENGHIVKESKFNLIVDKIKNFFTKWKIINSNKYWIIPENERKLHFVLSNKEYEESKKLYKEKGTISYEFYPGGGIGWGIKVHILKTNEIIDITSYDNW